MCSSTLGPAKLPSLLTWPMTKTVMPRPLASCMRGHGTLLNLGDAPRRGGLVPMVHGLDGVYNHNLGLRLLNGSDDLLQAALSKEVEVHLPHPQPVCAGFSCRSDSSPET